MFIEKCDIQNLSSIGAACETQKQHVAPMELDCGIMVFYKHIALNGAFHGIFQKNKLLQKKYLQGNTILRCQIF